jgi:hypothetical protein
VVVVTCGGAGSGARGPGTLWSCGEATRCERARVRGEHGRSLRVEG